MNPSQHGMEDVEAPRLHGLPSPLLPRSCTDGHLDRERTEAMKIVNFCLMTGLAFGFPFAATAQQNVAKGTPSDVKYCDALAKAYSSMWPVQEGMTVDNAFTLSQCNTDPRATIATLEKKMKDQNFALPPHEGVAQSPSSIGNAQ
jgi:hypothetical protein